MAQSVSFICLGIDVTTTCGFISNHRTSPQLQCNQNTLQSGAASTWYDESCRPGFVVQGPHWHSTIFMLNHRWCPAQACVWLHVIVWFLFSSFLQGWPAAHVRWGSAKLETHLWHGRKYGDYAMQLQRILRFWGIPTVGEIWCRRLWLEQCKVAVG